MYKDLFSIIFVIGPECRDEFLAAWSSLSDLDPAPEQAILFFNQFDYTSHDIFLDMADIRNCDIIKLNQFTNISRCWNLGITMSRSKHVIIANDDLIFKDEYLLQKLLAKHDEGYKLVHAAENWSCFSLDKSLILDIGWFEERLIHSWEDCNAQFQMERLDIPSFRFEPHLVRHLKSSKKHRADYWDQSSEFFFKKWDIAKLADNKNPERFNDPEARRQLQATGFFRQINAKNLKEAVLTPDYHPGTTQQIREFYEGQKVHTMTAE